MNTSTIIPAEKQPLINWFAETVEDSEKFLYIEKCENCRNSVPTTVRVTRTGTPFFLCEPCDVKLDALLYARKK